MNQSTTKAINVAIEKHNKTLLDKFSKYIEEKLTLDNESVKNLIEEFLIDNDLVKVKKPVSRSVFNYYVKDYSKDHKDIKGKETLVNAGQSWKTSEKGMYIKAKATELKKENPSYTAEQLYNGALALFEKENGIEPRTEDNTVKVEDSAIKPKKVTKTPKKK